MDCGGKCKKKFVFLAIGSLLVGCSDVRRDTFEIEYTTDDKPHKVELYYQAEGTDYGKWRRLFRLNFPQAYYGYRDNHDSLKQSAISLLLDKETLRPLTEVISSETGITETLATPRFREGELKRMVRSKYINRRIFVLLSGNIPTIRVPIEELRETYDRVYDFTGESNGIAFYRVRKPPNFPDNGLPELKAFSLQFPAIGYYCPSSQVRCSVTIPYRGAAATFSLQRNQLHETHDIAKRLTRLLEQHIVRS